MMNEYISDQSTPYRTIIPYPPTNKKDGPCGGRPPPSVGEPPPVCGGRSPPFPAGGGRVGVAPYEEGGPPPIIFLIFAQTRYPGTRVPGGRNSYMAFPTLVLQYKFIWYPGTMVGIPGNQSTIKSFHRLSFHTVVCRNKYPGCLLGLWHYAIFKQAPASLSPVNCFLI